MGTQDLKNSSALYINASIEYKRITWKDFEAGVYVRPMSYRQAAAGLISDGAMSDPIAKRIAECIVDKEGKPIFTVEDITGEADESRGPLDYDLAMALLRAINEVSNLGKKARS